MLEGIIVRWEFEGREISRAVLMLRQSEHFPCDPKEMPGEGEKGRFWW
jgi:hypothetical protein